MESFFLLITFLFVAIFLYIFLSGNKTSIHTQIADNNNAIPVVNTLTPKQIKEVYCRNEVEKFVHHCFADVLRFECILCTCTDIICEGGNHKIVVYFTDGRKKSIVISTAPCRLTTIYEDVNNLTTQTTNKKTESKKSEKETHVEQKGTESKKPEEPATIDEYKKWLEDNYDSIENIIETGKKEGESAVCIPSNILPDEETHQQLILFLIDSGYPFSVVTEDGIWLELEN